jgi:hypothetical protein
MWLKGKTTSMRFKKDCETLFVLTSPASQARKLFVPPLLVLKPAVCLFEKSAGGAYGWIKQLQPSPQIGLHFDTPVSRELGRGT